MARKEKYDKLLLKKYLQIGLTLIIKTCIKRPKKHWILLGDVQNM